MNGIITLGDLGERRILRDIIPQYVCSAGDDCAIIGSLKGHVVVTTDPVPSPAANVIGGDMDLYWLGWLLVTINASDVAASGAMPRAFVAALELPSKLPVDDLHRLLQGVRDSCLANGLDYVGGNLREAAAVGGVGTAIGTSKRRPLTRRGARLGDQVILIGEGGRFWADVERLRRGIPVSKERSPVFAPISQTRNVHKLHDKGLLVCAMDTSDGLAPTLEEVSRVNSLNLNVRLNSMTMSDTSLCERPERLWMGWGDWSVVAAVRPSKLEAVIEMLHSLRAPHTVIGEFVAGPPGVNLVTGTSNMPLGRLESERFAADSWFSKGVDEYRRMLHALALPPI